MLDFDRFPLSIYSQSNKNWLVNLKLKDQGQDKASIRKILTWGFFVKTSLFDSLFLVNLMFSLRIFYVFENVPCKALYSWKIGVWNSSQKMWDSFQTSVFNAENLPFLCLWNPTCVHRLVPAMQALRLRTPVHACVRRLRVFFGLYFPKNIFFYSLKSYFFN